MRLQSLSYFLCIFFFVSHTLENCNNSHKLWSNFDIDQIKNNLDIDQIKNKGVMHGFSKIQRHTSRVNHLTELLENWSVYGVTIVVQTCCGLKEIALTVMEL